MIVRPGLIAAVALAILGCEGAPSLPETFDVATTAAARTAAAANSGPAVFADSVWSIIRTPDPAGEDAAPTSDPGPYGGLLNGDALPRPPAGERVFLVHFGAGGEMVRVSENLYFLAEFYGEDVPVGGAWTNTTLPGIVFHSASYGVQLGERFGIAVVVDVRFRQLYLGRAILYAWGTTADATLTGQLGYFIDFTGGAAPSLGTIADQYPVSGERISP